MPPKKAKKYKKDDDEDFWANAGETIAPKAAPADGDESDHVYQKPKPVSFSALSAIEIDPGLDDDDDNDGGLMSAIRASTKKDNKKNKKGKQTAKDQDAVTAEEEAPPNTSTAPANEGEGDAAVDGDDQSTLDAPLSKKEKERLKKERDKAKKKAGPADGEDQASVPDTPAVSKAPAPPTPSTPTTALAEEEGEEGEGGVGEGSNKKKKKKKKAGAAKEEEKKQDPPAAAGKKQGGKPSALKVLLEKQRLALEEQRRKEEEEQRRIEEEERRLAEEERLREEAKQLKKEKEKAKRELAKKEGRVLTKKQKEQRATAEAQKQALLASGVKIEGLLQPGTAAGSTGPKKVVYGARKKKPTVANDSNTRSQDDSTSIRSHTPIVERLEDAQPTTPNDQQAAKEDWEGSDEDAESKPTNVADMTAKDTWEGSSNEDQDTADEAPTAAKPKQTLPTAVKATEPKTTAPLPQPTPKIQPPTPKVNTAPPADAKESSSEETSSDEDSDEDDSSEDEELTTAQKQAIQRKAEAAERRAKRHEEALAARNKDDLRSPICCILGHVDSGKTKLLDKIRQTNVQEGEAGGITQQIGATYFPIEAIRQKTTVLNVDGKQEYKIPGLLIIDTPGHESFTNLRTRGSSLCNIAVLVVDITHGLQPQTLESLRLLRDRKTPFIVALNKIDRLYGWVATPNGAFRESLAKQSSRVQGEFKDRLQQTVLALAEQGLNSVLYYENKSFAKNVSIVPTSAVSGEGVPDMIMLLVNLTQQRMSDRLMYLSELECTVLEVKVIEGLGTTIDVVLSNGVLREGDRIVVCGLNGPIVTQVRALLTPQPLRELRIKSAYIHNKEVKAALGVKISAPDLEKAIAGSRLLVVGPDDDEDDLREEVMSDLQSLASAVDKSGRGVSVQASTLGSLEALLDFLKASKIPVSQINIGPVHKKDVMRTSTMLEKAKELACILCFDVPVDSDAEKLAEELGIKIFKADIIYHLFDAFTAYNNEIAEAKRRDAAPQAIWPCRLKIIAAFAKRDPIILGVDILDGTLRVGTPLCVVKVDPTTQKKDIIALGKITSLEINHKAMEIVKKSQAGGGVAIKIEHAVYQSAKMFGRHFDDKDELLSHITRQSIDVLKESFKKDVSNEEWLLIRALKPRLGIP